MLNKHQHHFNLAVAAMMAIAVIAGMSWVWVWAIGGILVGLLFLLPHRWMEVMTRACIFEMIVIGMLFGVPLGVIAK